MRVDVTQAPKIKHAAIHTPPQQADLNFSLLKSSLADGTELR